MAFILYSRDVAANAPIEYIPCDDITVAVGDALSVAAGGHAVKATGTTAPTHISVTAKTVAVDGDTVGAVRITDGMVFETSLAEASASIAVGTKYTIDTSGSKITSTSTSGVCEVVSFDGKAAGDRALIRFK